MLELHYIVAGVYVPSTITSNTPDFDYWIQFMVRENPEVNYFLVVTTTDIPLDDWDIIHSY